MQERKNGVVQAWGQARSAFHKLMFSATRPLAELSFIVIAEYHIRAVVSENQKWKKKQDMTYGEARTHDRLLTTELRELRRRSILRHSKWTGGRTWTYLFSKASLMHICVFKTWKNSCNWSYRMRIPKAVYIWSKKRKRKSKWWPRRGEIETHALTTELILPMRPESVSTQRIRAYQSSQMVFKKGGHFRHALNRSMHRFFIILTFSWARRT